MKEITRIHLAKIPYEIEVNAKQDLESYFDKLNQYVADSEVVSDIEIRLTEILAERGVKSGGVIGSADIEAIRSQVGAPEEIVDEPPVEVAATGERKLYRDLDHGLVGGVVSGLAAYLRLDVALARIIFVVLAIITSGFALLVYVVMWLMVPAAKTAADKLRLRGRAVSVESIATMDRQGDSSLRRRGEVVRAVLLYLVGLGALIGAVASLFAVVAAIVSIFSEDLLGSSDILPAWYVAYGLAVLSGLLLATLCGLIAYASFKREVSKRFLVAVTIIIVTGLTSFGTAVGIGMFSTWQHREQIQASVQESFVDLPGNFGSVTAVEFSSDIPATIEYTVSDSPRMVLESTPGFDPQVKIDGEQAEISLSSRGQTANYMQPVLRVYGPALERVDIAKGVLSYTAKDQDSLVIKQFDDTWATVTGRVDQLEVVAGKDSSLYLAGAAIGDASLDLAHNSNLQLGNIGSLDIIHLDVCPADEENSVVTVRHIASGKLQLNGHEVSLGAHSTPCLEFNYGEEG